MKLFIAGLIIVLAIAAPAYSQIDEVRAAIARDDSVGALRVLSGISEADATPDTYLYRGIAYANLNEFERALDAFRKGASRYPGDPRFTSEALSFYRRPTEIVQAKSLLRAALLADPNDIYATDLLASLELSEGSTDAALRVMNQKGQPRIARVLDNYSMNFSSRVISSSLAFQTGEILGHRQWKTTAERLQSTGAFSSVALEIEPANENAEYNALVRTTRKPNTVSGLILGLLKGLPASTSFVDLWNLGGSFAHFNSSFRWSSSRRRAEASISLPVATPRLLIFEIGAIWRNELWRVPSQGEFRYRSTALRANVSHINDHRIEIGAGIEYLTRSPAPDTGRVLGHAQYRPTNGTIKSQVRIDGFAARTSTPVHPDFAGVTLSEANRIVLSQDHSTFIDLSIQGGTERGRPPVEDYFILGVDDETPYPLRAHDAAAGGVYGASPMGTDFVLLNNAIERRVGTAPLIHSPIQGLLFADLAKVFDRQRIFPQNGWFVDVGVGAKILLQDSELVLLYGKSLAGGGAVFSASIQRRFW